MEKLKPGDFVTLNVGGVPYTTSVLTLTSIPDSMLGGMFSGRIKAKRDEESGHYLIDRDGELFRYVLNFLRNRTLGIPEDFKELKMLLLEAEFYQIEPMCQAIKDFQKHVPEVIEVELRSFHELNQWSLSHWVGFKTEEKDNETLLWTIHGSSKSLRQVPCLMGEIEKLQGPSTTISSGESEHDYLRLKFKTMVYREAHKLEQFNRTKLFQEIGGVGFTLKATETHWPATESSCAQWQRWVFIRG